MDFSSERMARNVRQVSHLDIAGGGQIYVEGSTAYVGHMKAAEGTTIIDVADPARPAVLANIPTSRLSHAHKVRVVGNLMVVNVETAERDVDRPYSEGGIRIFDVSRPAEPVELGFFGVTGIGIHRFDFDGTYAYLSSSMDGYLHNIVVIVDLSDPRKPREVSRWWMPGQWVAGGETPEKAAEFGCHHPLRFGDRLYVSYLNGGVVILDIADIGKPRMVGHYDYHPAFAPITHTFTRMPFKLDGRDIAVAVDEQPTRRASGPGAGVHVGVRRDRRDGSPSDRHLEHVRSTTRPGAPRRTSRCGSGRTSATSG